MAMACQNSLPSDVAPLDGNGSGSEDSWTFLDEDGVAHNQVGAGVNIANEEIQMQESVEAHVKPAPEGEPSSSESIPSEIGEARESTTNERYLNLL